eukprot:Rhum_TRINITY_DN14473_c1_g1::Rhum_TRINITY_DN14473_c1_g1_i1::g.93332::m.93332
MIHVYFSYIYFYCIVGIDIRHTMVFFFMRYCGGIFFFSLLTAVHMKMLSNRLAGQQCILSVPGVVRHVVGEDLHRLMLALWLLRDVQAVEGAVGVRPHARRREKVVDARHRHLRGRLRRTRKILLRRLQEGHRHNQSLAPPKAQQRRVRHARGAVLRARIRVEHHVALCVRELVAHRDVDRRRVAGRARHRQRHLRAVFPVHVHLDVAHVALVAARERRRAEGSDAEEVELRQRPAVLTELPGRGEGVVVEAEPHNQQVVARLLDRPLHHVVRDDALVAAPLRVGGDGVGGGLLQHTAPGAAECVGVLRHRPGLVVDVEANGLLVVLHCVQRQVEVELGTCPAVGDEFGVEDGAIAAGAPVRDLPTPLLAAHRLIQRSGTHLQHRGETLCALCYNDAQ